MPDANTCPTCAAPLPTDATGGACPRCLLQAGFATGGATTQGERAPTPEELAPKFPGLVIESVLGRGGMGVVYKARHKALDRDVALKVLPESVSHDRAFADRFQREARALAKLQHPNIVGVHDFGQTDGLFWLVMEYVDGTNIRQAMKAGTIDPKAALAIVPQICDALQYAHEHGVVHRDIKPENVMLNKSGRVKVADFGLAKMMAHDAADRTLTGAGQVMGTPHYMAPEQVEHPADVDHRADIYSLGVVFYEMLTGELPLGRFAAPSGKCDVDARIDQIVLRTLEKEREARYQQVSQVKTDVGRATGAATATPAVDFSKPGQVFVNLEYDSAAEKARGGRLSKLAVVGACGVPIAIAAMVLTGYVTHHDGPTFLVGGIGFLAAMVVSIVAWVRVQHSGDRLRGRLWAAIGTFLPVVSFCLATPAFVLVSGETRPKSVVQLPDKPLLPGAATFAVVDEKGVPIDLPAADRAGIAAKWRRVVDLDRYSPLFAFVLYDRSVRGALSQMSEAERDHKARAGELGLPLLPDDRLPQPLTAYWIDRVQLNSSMASTALSATVTATDGSSVVRFPMTRLDGIWDFAVGPVEIK